MCITYNIIPFYAVKYNLALPKSGWTGVWKSKKISTSAICQAGQSGSYVELFEDDFHISTKFTIRLDLFFDLFDTVYDCGVISLAQKIRDLFKGGICIFSADVHDHVTGDHDGGILFSGKDIAAPHIVVLTDHTHDHLRRDDILFVRIDDILEGLSGNGQAGF